MPKQAPWPSSAPQPPAVEWDALIAEVVAAGAEVPELDWARPGEDAAAQARAPPVRPAPRAAQRRMAVGLATAYSVQWQVGHHRRMRAFCFPVERVASCRKALPEPVLASCEGVTVSGEARVTQASLKPHSS